jgi:hypothetical protein
MPPSASSHPTDSALAAFALGRLDPAAAAAVGAHLAGCPACRAVAEHTPGDSPAGPLRQDGDGPHPSPRAAAPAPPAAALAPADLPPELRDHPKYRVLRTLGQGGMGKVYLAEHTVMERLVAIKVIGRTFLDHPEAAERFGREAKAAARLDHPNLVKAYDAEPAGGLQLLVMEYVEGRTLADVLARKGPLPVANACHYARQAARGLQHAHEAGLVHRDLKPQNLMLTPQGVVKVLDFGLARLARGRAGGGLTQEGVLMGTPEYLAPEQATGARPADARSDVYALGCTLYGLLAGRPPFPASGGGDTLAVVLQHLQEPPPPLESLRPDVPPGLAALVARMLAKDPAQPPQTAAEVADALRPFAKREDRPARPPWPAPPTAALPLPAGDEPFAGLDTTPPRGAHARPARRGVWPVAAAVVAGAVLIGVGLWAGGDPRGKPSGATVALAISEPGAGVFLDGARVAVSRPGGGPVEARVRPGQRLEVRKAGFRTWSREVALEPGGRPDWTVRLEPLPAPPGPGPAEAAHAAAPIAPAAGRAAPPQGPPVASPPPVGRQAAAHGGRWRLDGAELVQESAEAAAALRFGDPAWADYDLEFEFRSESGQPRVGASFRTPRPGARHTVTFGADGNTRHALDVADGEVSRRLASSGHRVEAGRWYRVQVRLRGDSLLCRLDGQEAYRLTLAAPAAGSVTLHTESTAARFRNVRVAAPDGTALWEGPPELPPAPAEPPPAVPTAPPASPAPPATRPDVPAPVGRWIALGPKDASLGSLTDSRPQRLDLAGGVFRLRQDQFLDFPQYSGRDLILRAKVRLPRPETWLALRLRSGPGGEYVAWVGQGTVNGRPGMAFALGRGTARGPEYRQEEFRGARTETNRIPDGFVEVAFGANGDRLNLKVAGQPVAEARNVALTSGHAGIHVFRNSADVKDVELMVVRP